MISTFSKALGDDTFVVIFKNDKVIIHNRSIAEDKHGY